MSSPSLTLPHLVAGQWWPLFRPSQIIKSEFPEHRRQFVSDEASESSEHGSRERYRVDWDHYGDVSRVSTGPNGSVESHERDPEPRLPPARSGERVRAEERVKSAERLRSGEHEEAKFRPSEDISVKSVEGSVGNFFEQGSFSPSRDRLAEDFDGSKDFSFSNEESSNSIEFPSFMDGFGRQNKVATSYAAFSSVFAKPKLVSPRGRDLLHPVNSRSYPPNYTNGLTQARTPVSHFKFFNGLNTTGHNLLHGQQPTRKDPEFGVRVNHHDPEGLWVNHEPTPVKPVSRSSHYSPVLPSPNQLNPFVPKDHPVYRYVKNHGGQANQPLNRRNQDLHHEFRVNGSLQNHAPVQVQVQRHESVVRHVIPTKAPFASGFWKDKDSSWKESRNVESFHPPPPLPSPAAHSFLIIKKKLNNLDLRRIGRRNPHYVYIVRGNNRIS